jgi:K+-transporting ATPase ATPase B chain
VQSELQDGQGVAGKRDYESGKAVETAGDLDTILLDKTGTITIGNRKATNFYPSNGTGEKEFIEMVALSSLADETPEGKSIVELAGLKGVKLLADKSKMHFINFTAETRSSGVDLPDGNKIRKGAFDAIRIGLIKWELIPKETEERETYFTK